MLSRAARMLSVRRAVVPLSAVVKRGISSVASASSCLERKFLQSSPSSSSSTHLSPLPSFFPTSFSSTTQRRGIHLGVKVYDTSNPPFEKILIANRGEIACRVIRTARAMGVKTVAVYSDADAQSNHVKLADESVNVGPAPSAESYLNIPRIIEACKQTGAQAVHPGYGFLSENMHFCDELEKVGITFIGPKPFAIESMGDKIASKKLAGDAKVNIIPGFLGQVHDDAEVKKIANEIGYPVMIKASAGGGGKGMRVAWNDEEAVEGFKLSTNEAINSFGDDRIFLEKFIEDPRHIEIQVLLDSFGNGVYLNERECSIQRRNQKVIEEAPSTFIDAETRKAMGEQALALARAVDYQSAGTVEFLVDKHRNFYFLEMNTRLQVEHPITEFISGQDLVEHMLNVAAGRKLPITQEDIGVNGWAFESRVYAENPFQNFLPSIGWLERYTEPQGEGVRCDSGISEGSEISIHYDPLICKLVTHGATREEASTRMKKALDEYVIRGVTHNIPFLRDVYEHKKFIDGDITTAFIEEEYPDGFLGKQLTSQADTDVLLAAGLVLHIERLDIQHSGNQALDSFDPESHVDALLSRTVIVVNDQSYIVSLLTHPFEDVVQAVYQTLKIEEDGQWTIGEEVRDIAVNGTYESGGLVFDVDVNDAKHTLQVANCNDANTNYDVQFMGTTFALKVLSLQEASALQHMPVKIPLDTSKFIVSPMPGAVMSINVQPGDTVFAGQEVCVVEAMKMQNALRASKPGVVKAIMVAQGDTVAADQLLIEFEIEE